MFMAQEHPLQADFPYSFEFVPAS